MTNRVYRFATLAGLLAVVAGVSMLFAQQDDSAAQSEENFTGKIVFVQTNNEYDNCMLQNARLIKVAGRTFLAGTVTDLGFKQDWRMGLPARISWDAIVQYYPLSAEQAKRVQEANRQYENANSAAATTPAETRPQPRKTTTTPRIFGGSE